MTAEGFVPTSIARRLIARMQATHEKRRISVFAGPPGIGKTTAIDEFRARQPTSVAVVKVARRNAKEVVVLQHALEAVRQLSDTKRLAIPSSTWELRNYLFRAFCDWAGAEVSAAKTARIAADPLTIVFDEAQNLSRDALEIMRFWNDTDRCYAPFPIGLVFVGNSEFSLSGTSAAESVISAAVADRALYLQTFDYDDVTDGDLTLFIAARGGLDAGAVAAVVRSFRTRRALRSLRRVSDLLDELDQIAGGEAVDADTVRRALELA